MKEQRLAAILFSDIVGYSRLMGSNQPLAFESLELVTALHKSCIDRNNGILHKELGDGFLVSFSSATDACNCAIELNRQCKDQTGQELHIGIHLGEVIFQNDDIFGDGVNIASRVQAMAHANQILVSESIFLNVKNDPQINLRFTSEVKLKNIKEKYKLYEITSENSETLPVPPKNSIKWGVPVGIFIVIAVLAFFINRYFYTPDIRGESKELAIAVLPLRDLSETKSLFTEGLAFEIRSKLAALDNIEVRSNQSSLNTRFTNLTAKELGNMLNVSHVLEGGVQLFDNKAHFNLFLTNVEDDISVPVELKDFPLEDINQAQVMIAMQVVSWLDENITQSEQKRISKIPTENVEAHRNYLLGLHELNKGTSKIHLQEAENRFRKAIELDPNYVEAHVALAETYTKWGMYGYMDNRKCFELARVAAEEAIRLNPNSTQANLALAIILFQELKPNEALKVLEEALKDDPGNDELYYNMFRVYVYWNDRENALKMIKKANEYNPLALMYTIDKQVLQLESKSADSVMLELLKIVQEEPDNYYAKWHVGLLYLLDERYDKAIEILKIRKIDSLNTNWLLGHAYAKAGNIKEATRILNYLEGKSDTTYVPPSMIAYVYWGLDEKEEALEWMKKAYEVHDNFPIMMHAFSIMKDEPWFNDLFNLGTLENPRNPYVEQILQDF